MPPRGSHQFFRKRTVRLSITHKLCAYDGTQFDIGEARYTAPLQPYSNEGETRGAGIGREAHFSQQLRDNDGAAGLWSVVRQ